MGKLIKYNDETWEVIDEFGDGFVRIRKLFDRNCEEEIIQL